jgi:putative acetyltransferase
VSITIEPERDADHVAVRAVHVAAFPTPQEANLVDALRANGNALVSLVARTAGDVIGHVLFSPVTIERDGVVVDRGVGLAPLAVMPEHQKRGIGTLLARDGLQACRRLGHPWCVVLGDPAYYSRFGFARASHAGIENEYGAKNAFMIVALAGSLPSRGLAKYRDELRRM